MKKALGNVLIFISVSPLFYIMFKITDYIIKGMNSTWAIFLRTALLLIVCVGLLFFGLILKGDTDD